MVPLLLLHGFQQQFGQLQLLALPLLLLLHEFHDIVQIVLVLLKLCKFVEALFEDEHLSIQLLHVLSRDVSFLQSLFKILKVLGLVVRPVYPRRIDLLGEALIPGGHECSGCAHWEVGGPRTPRLLPRLLRLLLLCIIFLEHALVRALGLRALILRILQIPIH